MRSYQLEENFVMQYGGYEITFQPHYDKDKYQSELSRITFRPLTGGREKFFNIVHHTPQGRAFQTATIYAGRDQFCKFSSFWSDDDKAEHKCELKSYIGDISTSWGDGDNLGVWYTDPIINNGQIFISDFLTNDYRKIIGDSVSEGHGEDNEIFFLIFTLYSLMEKDSPANTVWYTKVTWEPVKAELQKRRG